MLIMFKPNFNELEPVQEQDTKVYTSFLQAPVIAHDTEEEIHKCNSHSQD